MTIGKICSRMVCVCAPGDALAAAAWQMIQGHVGALVVVDPASERARLLGIVTDRDIVCRQLDSGRDLFCLSVEDVMTRHVFVLQEAWGVEEAIARLSEWGVRRAPVVDASGNLVGILSLDDLLPALVAELVSLAQLLGTQSRNEGSPSIKSGELKFKAPPLASGRPAEDSRIS
jgi:CBS domain-containing protein